MRIKGRIGLAASVAAIFLLSALLGYREIFGPDIGFHLGSGLWIVENGSWPGTDPLTYTVGQNRYVDLQWLFQIALVGLHRVGGTLALVLANIGLSLAMMGLLLLRTARREGRLSHLAAPVLLLFALGNFWEIRPHAASWLLLCLALLILEEFLRGDARWLRALPAILLVWVNSHSLFILGLLVTGLFAVHELLRGRHARRMILVWGGLAGAACLANPYGIHGLLYPLQQFAEIHPGSLFKSEMVGVAEFLSPFSLAGYTANGALVLLQPLLSMQLYAALALIGHIGLRRRLTLPDLLLFLAFGYVFWRAQKNFGYFFVATYPATVSGLEALARPALRRRGLAAAVHGAVILGAGVLTAQLFSGWLYAQERLPHRMGHGFNRDLLPVRACEFLNARVPAGRLLNHWDYGGYVGFATHRQVFIDARTEVMGEEFFRDYLRLKHPATMRRELQRWRPEIVLVPLNFLPSWLRYFNESRDWRCVYADEQDLVYLHRSFAPHVPKIAPSPREPAGAAISASPEPTLPSDREIEAILDEGLARGRPTFLETMVGPHSYPLREVRLTALHLIRGDAKAALASGLQGLKLATIPCPDLVNNLVIAFLETGDTARAARCFEALPRARRDPRLAERLRRAAMRSLHGNVTVP